MQIYVVFGSNFGANAQGRFSDELVGAEVGLVFFAGHGMQIDDDNFLTAVDTNFNKELDAKYSAL